MLVELRGQLDEIARHRRSRDRRIGDVRQQPVQAVAELVEQRARVIERQQRRLALLALGEVHHVDDDRALPRPPTLCCERKADIQAPERFEGRAK